MMPTVSEKKQTVAKVKVKVGVKLPHPPRCASPKSAAARAAALLNEAHQASGAGNEAPEKTARRRDEFRLLTTPASPPPQSQPRPDEPRRPITNWRAWCREATTVSQQYQEGLQATQAITDLQDDAFQIQLPDSAEDAKRMVALKKELQGHAEQLAAIAYNEMRAMVRVQDYRKVNGMLLAHERLAETNDKTRRQWLQLQEHRDGLIATARATVQKLTDTEASVAVLEKRLAALEGFASDLRSDFSRAREEVQMREDTARYELQKVVKDGKATIGDLSAMIEKWAAASSVVKERGAVQKRLDADITAARKSIKSATACDAILVIDACLRQYARTCGDHLLDEIHELVQRGEELRNDMRKRLSSAIRDAQADPMEIFVLVERSNDYGADFDNPRRKAAQRLKQMEEAAEAEIRQMIPSTDYAGIQAVQKKYEGWPAGIQGALGMLENRREWLLSEATAACRKFRTSADITVLHGALEKYADYRVDCPGYLEVRKQHDKSLAEAIADLHETTVDESATIGKVEAVITRWNGVPGTEDAVNLLAERLARMTTPAEAELQRACAEPRLSAVDAVLQKYTREGGPSLLGSTPMLNLKRHRSKLCDDMRTQLRLGLALEDAIDISNLLEASVEYEVDLKSDRKALRTYRLKLANRAAGLMQTLQSSKDFVGIEKVLANNERCPPEALTAREGLQKHKRALTVKADKALKLALENDVPEIDDALQKYHEYSEACQQSFQALRARRDRRLREIKDELDQCLTLVDLKKWESKYATYTAVAGLAQEMKARFAYIVREITAECNAAADTKDYPVIARVLHKHERWAKHVDTPYKTLRRLLTQLVIGMEHDLKECTAGKFPKPIVAVVERSHPFGASVAKPREAAQARIALLIQEATKAMKDMCNSKQYTTVLGVIAQYDNFADETQATWKTLCEHRDALVMKAQHEIFELVQAADPNEIDKVIAKYTGKDKDYPCYDYGDAVKDAVQAASKRRAEIIGGAVAEMQVVLMSADSEGQDQIRSVLQKYQDFPADLNGQRDLLKSKLKMMCQSTKDRIRTATRSHDFELVDLCIRFCSQQQVDSSLTPSVQKLHLHRSRLVEKAFDKLEQSLQYHKPADIDRALNEAGPLFASSLRHVQHIRTEEEHVLGTADDDESTRVQKLRKDVEKYRSDLIAECVTKMDKILQENIPKVLENSLEKLVAFKDVDECQPKYFEMQTKLTAHQHGFREQVDELLSLDEPHPNEIKRLLAEQERYGPSVAPEERRLSFRLDKVVRRGNAQLLALTSSSDYILVRAGVQHFSDFPPEFADNFKLLQGHQAGLLAKAKQEFKTMCEKATHPTEIFSKAPVYYDVFQDEFESEKEMADSHVSQMVQHANAAMHAAQEGRTIWEMQSTVDKYAEYPQQETKGARDALISAIAKLAQRQSLILLAMCDGQDIPKMDAALAEKPFPLVVDAHNVLRDHREKLQAAALKVCDEALEATLPKDLDAAIDGAMPFGTSLESKRAAVMKRRRTIIKNARTRLSKVDTNSFPLVDAAVAEFDGFSVETDMPWKVLVARRNELLESSKEVLRQALRLHDPLQVDQVIESCLPFGDYVAEERQAAVKHAAGLYQSACAALKTAQDKLAAGESTLAAVETVLDKYSYLSAHRHVQGAFKDLMKAFNAGCDNLDRMVTEAIALPDIVRCHELIKQHSSGCRSTKEMVGKLVSHRADLIADYQARITKATAFVVDVDALVMLLEEVAPHEKHIGSKRIAALNEYVNELVKSNMQELTSMLKSDDFSKVCQVLEQYANDEHKAGLPMKVKEAIGQLRQHRADLIEKARAKLKRLSEEKNPNVIDQVLKLHAPFADTVEPELSRAMAQRKALIDGAIHDMLSKTTDSGFKTLSPSDLTELVESLHNVVRRYAHYPNTDDMESARKEVHEFTANVISACEDRLNQALTGRTFDQAKQIERMLEEFAPIKDHVAECFQLLDIHLSRIRKWDSNKFARATLQPHEQEKEEILTATMAKLACKQEQLVFRALAETYKLDQQNSTFQMFADNTPAKALREHSLSIDREPRNRPSAALIRAGRQVQREVSSTLFKGGTVYYSAGFDYHKLEWTMEDELAARFASEEGEDVAFSRPVTVEMSLAMDYDATVADPVKCDEFTKKFIADMAASLGCDPALLQIDGLAKGSVIVKFTLKASASGDGPSPVALGAKLNAMMKDPSSALTKSALLSKVNRTRGLLVAAKPLPQTKVLQQNHKQGMVNSREFSLSHYVSKFVSQARLGRLQLKESNAGLMATLDSTWEQLTALEQEHERLYNELVKLHNDLQWIEQPHLGQQLEDEKRKLQRRLDSQTSELPKIVMRYGMSHGTTGWDPTGWMRNDGMTEVASGSVLPGPSPRKIPVPPASKRRTRRLSAPARKVSGLYDGALSSNISAVADVKIGERESDAIVTIQRIIRGRKARIRYAAIVEQARHEADFKEQLAERYSINLEQLPTKMEVRGACHELGIDPAHPGDRELVWLAEEYLLAPLPKGWTEMYLAQYKAVAYITEQGKSSWAHPSKGYYMGLVRELRRLRAEYMFVAKDGLFAVAKVGAKIQAVLNAHKEEQTRLLADEADQLTGAEWTQCTYIVDGEFAGAHLSQAVAKQKIHANAYDPRRVTIHKIREKRAKLKALEESGDSASKDIAENLAIEIGVLEEDLKEANARLAGTLTSNSAELVPMSRPGLTEVTSDEALASLPALPHASPYRTPPRLARGSGV